MSSEEEHTLLEVISLLKGEVASLRADNTRKPAAPDITWVDEQELTTRIPYTLRQIRDARKKGVFRYYPCRMGTKKIIYNLKEVNAVIAGSNNSRPLLDYDRDNLVIQL